MTAPVTVGRLLRPRVRLVGSAVAVGAVLGVAGLVATLGWFGDATVATRKAFAVGALLLSLGLLGWSGSVFAGPGFEALQDHLDTGSNWSERDSRRAMARLGGVGLGWMVGAQVAGWLAGLAAGVLAGAAAG